jgi:hypothetical protein
MVWLLLIIGILLIVLIALAVKKPQATKQLYNPVIDPWDEILKTDDDAGNRQLIEIFLRHDKISPQKYFSNLAVLKQSLAGVVGRTLYHDEVERREYEKHVASITPSMHSFLNGIPDELPQWYVAAYPDVVPWMNENGHLFETEAAQISAAMDAGLKTTDDFLRWTVDCYKSKTKRRLECQM